MTLKEVQETVDNWIKEHGVRYFNELTNMAVLTEEVGELARIMARKYGEQSFKKGENEESLSEEIADVLFVLVCIANQTGVDLEAAFKETIKKKSERDKNRHKNNEKIS
jgi:NTP pyrophosphatase (non-canonical NTP hydrolase)